MEREVNDDGGGGARRMLDPVDGAACLATGSRLPHPVVGDARERRQPVSTVERWRGHLRYTANWSLLHGSSSRCSGRVRL